MADRLTPEERRRDPRVPADTGCWLERESLTLLGTVTNISAGGLFLRTPCSVSAGSEVELTIEIDGEPVVLKGCVAWNTGTKSASRGTGLGIRFDAEDSDDDRLEKYINQRKDGLL